MRNHMFLGVGGSTVVLSATTNSDHSEVTPKDGSVELKQRSRKTEFPLTWHTATVANLCFPLSITCSSFHS